MIDLRHLRELGTPWCIYTGMTAKTLITPRSSVTLPAGIAGGEEALSTESIIILGYQYDFVAAAAAGFNLVARSASFSPGGVTDYTILAPRASTAITRVEGGSDSCFIPLDKGKYVSPAASYAPASLVLTLDGAPSDGHLVIWGVMTDGSEFWVPNHNIYGEAFNLTSPPPY